MHALFPPIERLLPQSGPMALLDRVVGHDVDSTTCAVSPARSALFRDADGGIPAWVGLEYMAQCCAVHRQLLDGDGAPPERALLLGARRVDLRGERFAPDCELAVTARPAVGDRRLAAFECSVRAAADGALLARARLSFYVPREGIGGAGATVGP